MSDTANLTREEKIKLVRESITKVHIPPLFEELIAEGGGSYSAGTGINIDSNNVISVVIGELIDSNYINVSEDGKITLNPTVADKIDAIPEVKTGDVFVTTGNIKEVISAEEVKDVIENIVSEQLEDINPWTEYKK